MTTNGIRGLSVVLGLAGLVVLMPPAVGRDVVAAQGAAPSAAGDRAKFNGAWELVTIEIKDPASGRWIPTPGFNSNGYIIYAETGHMGVHIQPKVRRRFATNIPTGDEALEALRGYTAYFGSFTVNDKGHDKAVVHKRFGQINPGGVPEVTRYYDFETTPNGSTRLTLTPPPADGGGKEQARRRLVWQRMDDAPLSAEAKKFVGFWRLLYTDTYRMKDGKEVFHGDRSENRSGTSYIIYAPSGHMMVHLMYKDGRTKYSGLQPTPEEAFLAYRTYNGYFGRFVTYENHNPQFVYHSQQGTTAPGGYSEQKRFYQFTGNVLRLAPPQTLNDAGELSQGHLYWEKQGPVN
jgi:hypothetical protein